MSACEIFGRSQALNIVKINYVFDNAFQKAFKVPIFLLGPILSMTWLLLKNFSSIFQWFNFRDYNIQTKIYRAHLWRFIPAICGVGICTTSLRLSTIN